MTFFFTPHSKRRFTERYGFEPTISELGQALSAVRAGEALLMREGHESGARSFRVKVRGVHVYPVVSPDWVIITFLPPDFFLASHGKARREKTIKVMRGRLWGRDPYKRVRAEIEFGDET